MPSTSSIPPSTMETGDIPPFPQDVPIAPLHSIQLKKLVARDEDEMKRLMHACETLGFFYLDLQDAGDASHILDDVDQLFRTSEALFDLPLAEKKLYDFSGQRSYFGYKPQGTKVVDAHGNVDRNENYNVPRDDMLGIITTDSIPKPDVLEHNRPSFQSMMKRSHSITSVIFDIINDSLGLPPRTLTNLHRIDCASGDLVRLIKAAPHPSTVRGAISLPEHTDYGSLTIVFNRLGGLQVFSPPGPDAKWEYVMPLSNHAVVNVGDALVKFTNGLLHSNLHRIVAPPGEQGDYTRYSVLYFSRPDDDVLLRPLAGSTRIVPPGEERGNEEYTSAKEWVLQRGMSGRADKMY